jgi:regulator of cell morphogenesis and NO signaling
MSIRLSVTPELTLNEVARAIPSAISVFEEAEIDYSCKGQRTLADAASESGYQPEEIIAWLENADGAGDGTDWFTKPLSGLTAYLVNDHVSAMGERVPALRGALAMAIDSFERQQQELERMRLLLETLTAALSTHILHEERELFPCIHELELANNNGGAVPTMRIGQRVLRELVEHETFRDRLRTLRGLADRLPSNDAVVALRRELRELSREVHRHMHLENNVLYPRAIDIENKLRRVAVTA